MGMIESNTDAVNLNTRQQTHSAVATGRASERTDMTRDRTRQPEEQQRDTQWTRLQTQSGSADVIENKAILPPQPGFPETTTHDEKHGEKRLKEPEIALNIYHLNSRVNTHTQASYIASLSPYTHCYLLHALLHLPRPADALAFSTSVRGCNIWTKTLLITQIPRSHCKSKEWTAAVQQTQFCSVNGSFSDPYLCWTGSKRLHNLF